MNIEEVFSLLREDMEKVELELRKNLYSEVSLIPKVGEHLLNGGKRFRPLMLILSARLLGYTGNRQIPLASILEFIHAATLLHDDVIDNAPMRRGNVSVNYIWGNVTSILVGDFLFSRSFHMLVSDGDLDILKVLALATTQMAEGEVFQLLKSNDIKASEEDYLSIVKSKTAILISSACQMGAILGKANLKQREALAHFGLNLGIAYQFIDDTLDYNSQEKELGKAVGNDLREGKITLPLIHTVRQCSQCERKAIARILGSKDRDNLDGVLELIRKYKGVEYTKEAARNYAEKAKKFLTIFQDSIEKRALFAVADFVTERKH